MSGPLTGKTVVEMAGMGPGPFAGMLLADMGADVIRIERLDGRRDGVPVPAGADVLRRGKRSIRVDLKHPDGPPAVRDIVRRADALIEGMRPGVMERLGLGPDACLDVQPRLVYGRVTGFGQDGPLASAVSHDINCIALGGVLAHVGRAGQPPTPPMGLIGDFGGAGALLTIGLLAGMIEADRSGQGQVVDAAMTECAGLLMSAIWGMRNSGFFLEHERGINAVDSGAPFYDSYRCSDGEYVSIGSIETRFFEVLLDALGVADEPLFAGSQQDRQRWPAVRARLATIFATRTRDEWTELLQPLDICFAPVLRMSEAARHPHARHRRSFVEVAGVEQPAPAPRFGRTVVPTPAPPDAPGAATVDLLTEAGYSPERIQRLIADGAVAPPAETAAAR